MCVCVPEVACISEGAVAGDAFALPLVEGVQGVRVIARLPAASAQVTPLVETLQHVLPLCIRDLSTRQEIKYITVVVFYDWGTFGVRATTLPYWLVIAPWWAGAQAKTPLSYVTTTISFCSVQI